MSERERDVGWINLISNSNQKKKCSQRAPILMIIYSLNELFYKQSTSIQDLTNFSNKISFFKSVS